MSDEPGADKGPGGWWSLRTGGGVASEVIITIIPEGLGDGGGGSSCGRAQTAQAGIIVMIITGVRV